MGAPRKVLIVDDSKSMGQFLTMILNQDPALDVVGHALDAFEARDMIKQLNPDVLTLDVEMPRMDGITFLRNLMRLRPMPVVMLSSLTAAGAEVTLDALAIGAVDFAVKRHPADDEQMQAYAADIRNRVRHAAMAVPPSSRADVRRSMERSSGHSHLIGRGLSARAASRTLHRVIAVGASTGGPAAVSDVLKSLVIPESCVLLSQHMPAHFMEAYADRLDHSGRSRVVMATDGQVLEPGKVYVAPGDRHIVLRKCEGVLSVRTSDAPKRHDHRPSVDVMFESVAEVLGESALGVILTGMGQDGAEGLCKLRAAGAITVAQDEPSSVVWGMPGSAVRAGGADTVEPLNAIGPLLSDLARRPAATREIESNTKPPVRV